MRDLLRKLQEAEWQHQSDRMDFEVRLGSGEKVPQGLGHWIRVPVTLHGLHVFSGWVPPTGKAWL